MRLVIADDHAMVRKALKTFFEHDKAIEIVGEADDGERAVALARELQPDAITLDISMPRLNGIDAIRKIRTFKPDTKFLVISMHDEPSIVTAAIEAGCHAYVLKQMVYQELNAALKAVARGDLFMSPAITNVAWDNCQALIRP